VPAGAGAVYGAVLRGAGRGGGRSRMARTTARRGNERPGARSGVGNTKALARGLAGVGPHYPNTATGPRRRDWRPEAPGPRTVAVLVATVRQVPTAEPHVGLPT
jgi:hypothetical protein